MKLDIQTVPLVVWMTAALLIAGVSFEVGYFKAVGIGFIFLASATEWILALSIVAVPIAILFPVATALIGAARSLFGPPAERPPLYVEVILLLAAPALLALAYFIKDLSFINAIFTGIFISAFFVQAVSTFSFYRDDPPVLILFEILAVGSFLMFYLGHTYAKSWSGDTCSFAFVDKHSETKTYLRALGTGYLLRDGTAAVYLTGDQVERITCPLRKLGGG